MKKLLSLIVCVLLLTGCNVSNSNKDVKLYCDEGNLVNGRCQIIETMQPIVKCRGGYTFNEKNGKCENSITIAAKKVSECPDGYYIGSDNWCLSDEVFPKEKLIVCSSPNIVEGDAFSSTYTTDAGACIEKLCVKVSEDGTSCLEFKETQLVAVTKLTCPSWTKEVDGECKKKYWMNKEYSCELGEMVGNNCVIKDSVDMEPHCEEKNYRLNKDKGVCEKIIYRNPTEKKID